MVNLGWIILEAIVVLGVIAACSLAFVSWMGGKKPPEWFQDWMDNQESKFNNSEM